MTGDPGPEPSAAGRTCPACGSAVTEAARFCPACGHWFTSTASEVDISRWLQAAWRLFASDIALAIGIGLISVVPVVASLILGYVGAFALIVAADPTTHAPRGLVAIPAVILGLIALGMALVWPALQAGVYACFLEGLRTGRLTAHHLGRGFRHWWACTWTAWLSLAATGLCMILCFLLVGIPAALAVAALTWLTLFHIVDRGRGGMEALSFAAAALRGRFWMMLVYTLLVTVLMNAGVMAMYIGIVITVPLGLAAFAAGYDDLLRKVEPPAA